MALQTTAAAMGLPAQVNPAANSPDFWAMVSATRAETAAASAKVSDELLPDPLYGELVTTLGVTLARRNLRVTRYLEQGDAKAALAVWEAAVRADPEWADPAIRLADGRVV